MQTFKNNNKCERTSNSKISIDDIILHLSKYNMQKSFMFYKRNYGFMILRPTLQTCIILVNTTKFLKQNVHFTKIYKFKVVCSVFKIELFFLRKINIKISSNFA